jgi:hypothetical protein
MRVFRCEILEKLYPLPDGLNLTPIMSTRALHENIRMTEVPIPYSERVGRSKLSVLRDGSEYLQSITWTVLAYNPVRVFGLIGLAGVGVAFLVGLWLVIERLNGVTSLTALGVAALFTALVCAVTGVSIFSLGVVFNYLVSLFYKRPIRQGLFGKPIFKEPIGHKFGWLGIVVFLLGLVMGVVILVFGANGGDIARLWFYLVGSSLLMLVGVQLVIFWILIRILEDLSVQEIVAKRDLDGL